MLSAHHLSKTYGIQPILQDVSLNISAGDRIGLIGPNGSGKTTLLRILVGEEQPDGGTVVHTRPNLRIGYLAQGMDFDPGRRCAPRSGLPPFPKATSPLKSNPWRQPWSPTPTIRNSRKNSITPCANSPISNLLFQRPSAPSAWATSTSTPPSPTSPAARRPA